MQYKNKIMNYRGFYVRQNAADRFPKPALLDC